MKKSENRKTEIMETAKRLFIMQGYEKTTVEQIIGEIGVSKGAFYHYYKSKDAVLEDVLSDIAKLITYDLVNLMTNKERNPKQKMEDLLYYKRKIANEMINIENTQYKKFWIEFSGIISDKCLNIVRPLFINIIYEGMEQGYFNILNPMFTSYIFTSLVVSASSVMKEYGELYDDIEGSMAAAKDFMERILGCEFND